MKIFFFALSLFIYNFAFADNTDHFKVIKDDQSCIYNTIIKNWDFKSDTLIFKDSDFIIKDKDIPDLPIVVLSLKTKFYCKKTALSKDSMLYIHKDSLESWSNIKAYWFLFKTDVSSLENQPHLYQNHYKIGDFDVFEFHMDYPL